MDEPAQLVQCAGRVGGNSRSAQGDRQPAQDVRRRGASRDHDEVPPNHSRVAEPLCEPCYLIGSAAERQPPSSARSHVALGSLSTAASSRPGMVSVTDLAVAIARVCLASETGATSQADMTQRRRTCGLQSLKPCRTGRCAVPGAR